MKIILPSAVQKALDILNGAGYEAFIVGGCVRDALMGIKPKDYDITTSAPPTKVMEIFSGCPVIETGLKHGTVTVIPDGMPLEITTYRTESAYSDHRHPDAVCFAHSLREDLSRRDFTMNALAYHPHAGLMDFYGGQEDIRAGRIRCVGDPALRFCEDALRIMRALRFSAVLGFEIDRDTLHAAIENKAMLAHVSKERIAAELTKLLCGKDVYRVLTDYTVILGEILPELLSMRGFDQRNPHHIHDILTHTALTVTHVPPTVVLRLAALFHDMGKPACFSIDKEGVGHFFGHAAVSAQIADTVLQQLKFDNATRHTVTELVRYHDIRMEPDEKAVKRMLNRFTPELFFDLLALCRADNLSQSPAYRDRQTVYDAMETLARRILSEKQCFSRKDLALNGTDLLTLGVPPGMQVGTVLQALLDAVINGDVPNERSALIAYLQTAILSHEQKS